MKIVCDFCKTSYTLNRAPNGPVKCAVCGHTWTPYRPLIGRTFIKFIAALCALISVCIFAFVVVMVVNNRAERRKPLIASIDEKNVRVVQDENGINRIFVAGNIKNNTEDVYGLPNIEIVSYDAKNNILSRQTFLPPATFIDGKTTITFNHILSVEAKNVKRVAIELKGIK